MLIKLKISGVGMNVEITKYHVLLVLITLLSGTHQYQLV